VFPAGAFITAEGGHSTENTPDEMIRMMGATRLASGPDEWRQAVREQFHKGADVIKLGSHFSAEEVKAAIAEAHELGLKVTVDAETFYVQRAVEAGADTIEHPLPRSEETIQLMAKKGVAADPTLIPYQIIFEEWGGYFESTSRRFTFSKDANLEMLKRLRKAGIKCGVGTDLILHWYRYMPAPYIRELKNFVEAGWSVPEALVAATKINSEILDMDDRLGTLQAGKLADVLVVDGRPDENLDDLAKVDLVIRDVIRWLRGPCGDSQAPSPENEGGGSLVQCKMLIFNSIDGMRGTECRGCGNGAKARQAIPWRRSRSRVKWPISTGNCLRLLRKI